MIVIPKDLEFEGTGHKGAVFEQKGLSERNLQTMLKALSNPKAQKAVELLASIKKGQWAGIATNLNTLKMFVDPTATDILDSFKKSITDTISLKFGQILSPIKNEIYAMLNDTLNEALGPIMPYINEGLKWVGIGLDAVMDGLFLVGVGIGWYIQQVFYWFFPDETPEAKAAEAERAAKARRVRYQFGNIAGPGGRSSGLQSGSGSIGPPPDAPSTQTTSREQE